MIFNKKRLLALITAAVTAFSALSAVSASAAENTLSNQLPVSAFAELISVADAASLDEAAEYVRNYLKQRNSEFSVSVPYAAASGEEADKLTLDVLAQALSETDKGDEGDYIRFTMESYQYGNRVSGGRTALYYRITYYSTPDEEKAVDKAVAQAEAELHLDEKSDREKIYAVYDFIAKNVKYSKVLEENNSIFTAYGAIINKDCVCQGYSLLLYRMLKDAGIGCRIISGTSKGERHTWNLIKLGGKYYCTDLTWDAALGGTDGPYFLKGSADFDNYRKDYTHVPVFEYEEIFPDYNSDSFKAEYPTWEKRFILGDSDENGILDGNDASAILSCYAAMSIGGNSNEMSPVSMISSDITGDGIVDGNDASGLLAYYAAFSSGLRLSLYQYLSKR